MMGATNPLCIRRPRVAVLSTGDELVDPATTPGPCQIRDSNRYTLAALATEFNADLHSTHHLPDNLAATTSALRAYSALNEPSATLDNIEESHILPHPTIAPSLRRRGLGEVVMKAPSLRRRGLGEVTPADVIITSGGVSVGDRDYVKPALESIGSLDLWRVNMKPGKPIAFGRIPRPDGGETLFFGLPGNPVSTMVTFELFVRPALWKLAGRRHLDRPRITVTLTDDVTHNPGRQEFVRAVAVYRQGVWHATPTGAQGSANLGSMLGANALIIVSAESSDLPAGSLAEALLLGIEESSSGRGDAAA
jgi:molybdopterin biosynthesis enzyme